MVFCYGSDHGLDSFEMSAVDHSVPLDAKIAVPLTVGVFILFALAFLFRDRLATFCPWIRSRNPVNYNAPPVDHYEPLRRWSNTSRTTSVTAQSRRQPHNKDILSIVETGELPSLPAPARPADDTAHRAPIALHWHTRQQSRSALNNTALRTLREDENQEMC